MCSGNSFEREKRLSHRLERAAMDWTGSKFMESGEMKLGAVALVLVETILRKFRAEVTHDSIPRDFGDHTGGRDRQTIAIAVDDCSLRKWKWKYGKTIDQHVLRRGGERGQRDPHGFVGRAQDVNPINLEMIDHADGPRDFRIRNQLIVNFVAAFRRKLFGVVQFP